MSDLYPALSVDIQEDLLPLSALLHQRGVRHQIFERNGRQMLMVHDAGQVAPVEALYQSWRSGEVRIELTKNTHRRQERAGISWPRSPITLGFVLLGMVGFLLVYLPALNPLVGYFTYTPLGTEGGVSLHSIGHQYWRLVTPIFLHFGWLHIAFNCMWMWDLGRRIEGEMGHFNTLMLFLVLALVSNGSQFVYGGVGVFGGLSGVVYGLLGFAWVSPLLQPRWAIQPPAPIMMFMVGWLALCLVGFTEALGFGAIANAAHLSGLICGALLGGVFGLLSRFDGDRA